MSESDIEKQVLDESLLRSNNQSVGVGLPVMITSGSVLVESLHCNVLSTGWISITLTLTKPQARKVQYSI